MSHESSASKTHVWLTPPHIIDALGGWQAFDFDPCAAPEPRPWPTAQRMNARADGNGLLMQWHGRVWLNPPYDGDSIAGWLSKMAGHNRGTALLGVRTENEAWEAYVWPRAAGMLFLHGRLNYCHPNGRPAKGNAGHASVLCAYGQDDLDRLAASNLRGAFVPLRFARYLLVDALVGTWGDEVRRFLERQAGPISLGEAYRHFARHPKAQRNRHWQAKVRQQLQLHGERIGPARYRRAGECARLPGL
jgi:hypothetical protein